MYSKDTAPSNEEQRGRGGEAGGKDGIHSQEWGRIRVQSEVTHSHICTKLQSSICRHPQCFDYVMSVFVVAPFDVKHDPAMTWIVLL